MIISVHVPKAGGLSTLKMLQKAFGEERVLNDWIDDPGDPKKFKDQQSESWMASRPTELSQEIEVVHGHFRPIKYALIPNVFWFTFLRHPVDNILSIYRYWTIIPEQPHTLHRKFKRNPVNIIDFAKIETFKHLYSQVYFGGWDMDKMDFVGTHERRNECFSQLGKMLGIVFDVSIYVNKTLSNDALRETIDQRTHSLLTTILKDDIAFYERYTSRF